MPETIYLNNPPRQQQQQSGFNPFQMYNMFNNIWGGGGSGSMVGGNATVGGGPSAGGPLGSAGGMWGSMGPYAAIGAAIIAQQIMAQNTNREFEGQRTGGITSGNFTTEPWLAFLSDRMGWGFTPGEKFDAARKNNSSAMMRRAPAAIDYWADPARGFLGQGSRGIFGNTIGSFIEPIGGLLNWFGD